MRGTWVAAASAHSGPWRLVESWYCTGAAVRCSRQQQAFERDGAGIKRLAMFLRRGSHLAMIAARVHVLRGLDRYVSWQDAVSISKPSSPPETTCGVNDYSTSPGGDNALNREPARTTSSASLRRRTNRVGIWHPGLMTKWSMIGCSMNSVFFVGCRWRPWGNPTHAESGSAPNTLRHSMR